MFVGGRGKSERGREGERMRIWLVGELVEINEKLIQAEFIRQSYTSEFHFKVNRHQEDKILWAFIKNHV